MNPLLRTRRTFAAKIEADPGTAETLTTADAEFNAFNSIIQANIEMHQRENPSGFGNLEAIPGATAGTCTFQTELYGDGNGGVPFWADRLFPACGYERVGNLFMPSAGTSATLSIRIFQDGRAKQLTGAAGNVKMKYEQGKPIMLDWNFSGIFERVVDQAIIVANHPTDRPIRFSNAEILLGGVGIGCVNAMEIDLGSEVVLRPCANRESAIESGTVTDSMPKATLDPEAQLVADDDTFGKWLDGESQTFSLSVTNETDRVTFAGPAFQRTNVQETDRTGVEVDQTNGQFNSVVGSGLFSIEFSAA